MNRHADGQWSESNAAHIGPADAVKQKPASRVPSPHDVAAIEFDCVDATRAHIPRAKIDQKLARVVGSVPDDAYREWGVDGDAKIHVSAQPFDEFGATDPFRFNVFCEQIEEVVAATREPKTGRRQGGHSAKRAERGPRRFEAAGARKGGRLC